MKRNFLFIFLLIIYLFFLNGCDKKISGEWEANIDITIYNKDFSPDIERFETLPLNIVIEVKDNLVYIYPSPYLKNGFTGKGEWDSSTGKIYFKATSFKELIYIESKNLTYRDRGLKTQDIEFQGEGEVSPEKDYITGKLTGKLILITDNGKFPCDIKEGKFTIIKKLRN